MRAWEELWGVTLDQIGDYNILEDPQLEAKGVLPFLRKALAGEAVRIPAVRYDHNETLPDLARHRDDRPLADRRCLPAQGHERAGPGGRARPRRHHRSSTSACP
jgi:hypothetical protein